MDTRHRSPSLVDWTNDESLTDHDELALDAIRRQLDMEFPHFVDIVSATDSALSRPERAGTVLHLVLACAGGSAAAAVLLAALYLALTPPAVVPESPPLTAATPRLVTTTAPRRAAPSPPPVHVDRDTNPASRQRATRPAVTPVPDVIRVVEPGAASIPTAVATPSPVDDDAAPSPLAERGVMTEPHVQAMQLAGEQVRTPWNIVRDRLVRPSGELAPGPRSRPEAP